MQDEEQSVELVAPGSEPQVHSRRERTRSRTTSGNIVTALSDVSASAIENIAAVSASIGENIVSASTVLAETSVKLFSSEQNLQNNQEEFDLDPNSAVENNPNVSRQRSEVQPPSTSGNDTLQTELLVSSPVQKDSNSSQATNDHPQTSYGTFNKKNPSTVTDPQEMASSRQSEESVVVDETTSLLKKGQKSDAKKKQGNGKKNSDTDRNSRAQGGPSGSGGGGSGGADTGAETDELGEPTANDIATVVVKEIVGEHLADTTQDETEARLIQGMEKRLSNKDHRHKYHNAKIRRLYNLLEEASKQKPGCCDYLAQACHRLFGGKMKISERKRKDMAKMLARWNRKFFLREYGLQEERYGYLKKKNVTLTWPYGPFGPYCEKKHLKKTFKHLSLETQYRKRAEKEVERLDKSINKIRKDLKVEDAENAPGLFISILKNSGFMHKMISAAATLVLKVEMILDEESDKNVIHKMWKVRPKIVRERFQEALNEFLLEVGTYRTENVLPLLNALIEKTDGHPSHTEQEQDLFVKAEGALLKPIKEEDYVMGAEYQEKEEEDFTFQDITNKDDIVQGHYDLLLGDVLGLVEKGTQDVSKDEFPALWAQIQDRYTGHTQLDRFYRRLVKALDATPEDPDLIEFFVTIHRQHGARYAHLKEQEVPLDCLTRLYYRFLWKCGCKRSELRKRAKVLDIYEQARAVYNQDVKDHVKYMKKNFSTKEWDNRVTLAGNMVKSLIQFEQKYLLSVVKGIMHLYAESMETEIVNMISDGMRSAALWTGIETVSGFAFPKRVRVVNVSDFSTDPNI